MSNQKISALLAGLALSFSLSVQASSVVCKESAQYKKENPTSGYGNTKITVSFALDDNAEVTLDFKTGKTTSRSAAKIDKVYGNSTRYIADDNFASSDSGDTGIFISNSILSGEGLGRISITSNQANDGDSGPQYLWGTDTVMECK